MRYGYRNSRSTHHSLRISEADLRTMVNANAAALLGKSGTAVPEKFRWKVVTDGGGHTYIEMKWKDGEVGVETAAVAPAEGVAAGPLGGSDDEEDFEEAD